MLTSAGLMLSSRALSNAPQSIHVAKDLRGFLFFFLIEEKK